VKDRRDAACQFGAWSYPNLFIHFPNSIRRPILISSRANPNLVIHFRKSPDQGKKCGNG